MIKFGPSGNSESFYAEGYGHTEQAASFVKNFRQALAVLSTSQSREERLKAFEILLSLTENELSNWDYKNNSNNKNLQIMANEIALI